MPKKDYVFFMDESGDHGLSFIDENFPIFLLTGCLFEVSDYEEIVQEINMFKHEFFGATKVILHSRDIRKCEGSFQILFDLELKKRFYERLNTIISNAKISIITVAIDKRKFIEKYGKVSDNPYKICLSFILERLVLSIDDESKKSTVSIIIEKRGSKEDAQLLAHYNRIMDVGTLRATHIHLKHRITGFNMTSKKDNNIGLQVADLCAYPIARHVLNSEEPYEPYNIIKNKLCHIKIFP